MKKFKTFLEEKNQQQASDVPVVPPTNQSFGSSVPPNPQSIEVLGQIVKVLNQQLLIIKKLLEHHDHKIGYQQSSVDGYRKGGTLSSIKGSEHSEASATKNIIENYKTLMQLVKTIGASGNRDIDLFMKDLSKTITEGNNFSLGFRVAAANNKPLDEDVFDMLRMNHQKLVRLLDEGKKILYKHNPDFFNSFSSTQNEPTSRVGINITI